VAKVVEVEVTELHGLHGRLPALPSSRSRRPRIALRVGRRGVIVNTSADWQNRAAERNSEGVRSLDAQEAWVPSRGRGRR